MSRMLIFRSSLDQFFHNYVIVDDHRYQKTWANFEVVNGIIVRQRSFQINYSTFVDSLLNL